jgi:folylpolyglutamate synthase
MAAKDYAAAVAALNDLQTNSAVVAEVRKHGKSMNDDSIPDMLRWLKKIGYEPSDFKSFNAIHISGTKGKGSTSAFVSRIL